MSMWEDRFVSANRIYLENGGKTVKVMDGPGTSRSTSFNGQRAVRAYFSGGYLCVEMESGERRKYDAQWTWGTF